MSIGFEPTSGSMDWRTLPAWGPEVEAFLSRLATVWHVSTSTHRQALSALLIFYGRVLGVDLL